MDSRMSFVSNAVVAVPDYEMSQEEVVELGREILRGKVPFLDQALDLFRNAGVDRRYLVRSPRILMENKGLQWRNDIYIEETKKLGERLMTDLFETGGVGPKDIDLLITTSCTGFMIPALDAHLMNVFEMRQDVRRMPFTELGCAAGAMALSRAHEHLLAFPDHRVAIVAIEIPSMTYLHKDMSVANLVSVALFGDGGAAVLVDGREGPLEILHCRSHLFRNTPEMMGFDLVDEGFRIFLDKRVPDLLREQLPPVVESFLSDCGVEASQIRNYLFHPGGRKILDTVDEIFDLDELDLLASRETLREVGNLSSATILWVIHKALNGQGRDGYALLGAFGPGFNAELLLSRLTLGAADGSGALP